METMELWAWLRLASRALAEMTEDCENAELRGVFPRDDTKLSQEEFLRHFKATLRDLPY
jgi:hypothetical protein